MITHIRASVIIMISTLHILLFVHNPLRAAAQDPAAPPAIPVLHAIFVADTFSEDLGPDMGQNAQALHFAFEAVPPNFLKQVNVFENQVNQNDDAPQRPKITKRSVLRAIRGLSGSIAPNDAVMFYYCGHGAFDPQNGPYMTLSQDKENSLFRSEVLEALDAIEPKPRLILLFTDSCNLLKASLFPPSRNCARTRGSIDPEMAATPSFAFCYPARETDRSVFGGGELSFCYNPKEDQNANVSLPRGSLFSQRLAEALRENGQPTTWKECIDGIKGKVADDFRAEFPEGVPRRGQPVQQTQTVTLEGSLPEVTTSSPANLLGLTVKPQPGGGLIIEQVTPGSIGEEQQLKPGDVLFRIGQREVNRPEDFSEAIRVAGQGALIRIVGRSLDGTPFSFVIRLPGGSGRAVPPPGAASPRVRFGVTVRNFSNGNSRGAYITAVDNGSPASRIEVKRVRSDGSFFYETTTMISGDIINRVNRRIINNKSDFVEAIQSLPANARFEIGGYDAGNGYRQFTARVKLQDEY